MVGGFTLYIPRQSVIHKTSAVVKLLLTTLYLVLLFLLPLYCYPFLMVMLLVVVSLSKVGLGNWLLSLRPILLFLAFSWIFPLLFTPGKPLVTLGFITITHEGVLVAIRDCSRLFFAFGVTAIVPLTTTVKELSGAIKRALCPLSKLGVPVNEVALMIEFCIRFLPMLSAQVSHVILVQRSRGLSFRSKSPLSKVRMVMALFVPVIVGILRNAKETAIAIEARGYSSKTVR